MNRSIAEVKVDRIQDAENFIPERDFLAVEEPLEIRLEFAGKQHSLSITMRTPGADFDLASGFLLTEGIIDRFDQISKIEHCDAQKNIVNVELASDVKIDFQRLQRHFYTSSSCGVCGKTSIEALQINACPDLSQNPTTIDASLIHSLPEKLREAQIVFSTTGGLHAAALFDRLGHLILLREDVGRHNAVDKLIGAQFRAGKFPLSENLLLVSGRASFELVQKALMAGAPILAAVGAPSSLAVELAENFGMTLMGFVRDQRFNIYCGAGRINR